VDAVFSCQTGEGIWARELSIAHLRNVEIMPEPQKRYLLAGSMGDAGAAGGAIQVAYLVHLAGRRKPGRRKLDRAIVYGAADGGDVGACVVSVR
jgi:3-oxoacyl-[acyl-carrier-protein] synthase-1